MKSLVLPLTLILSGCLQQQMGITVVQPKPDIPEPPRPMALRRAEAPRMQATAHSGLTRSIEIKPTLYYWEPDDLWYTFYKGRWHQAFFWNGTWFEPERVPSILLEMRSKEPRSPPGSTR